MIEIFFFLISQFQKSFKLHHGKAGSGRWALTHAERRAGSRAGRLGLGRPPRAAPGASLAVPSPVAHRPALLLQLCPSTCHPTVRTLRVHRCPQRHRETPTARTRGCRQTARVRRMRNVGRRLGSAPCLNS